MRLTFIGATRTVTGSCFHVEAGGRSILVDCGMYQGGRELEARNRVPFPFHAADVEAVVLTHAHIDHSGLLPRLVAEGFKGAIHCHAATAHLAAVMLRDSAHIQELHATTENRKRGRRGLEPIEPVYSPSDAEAAIALLSPVAYGRPLELLGGAASVEFVDAGHILGSTSVRLTLREPEGELRVLFSGDVGNAPTPILNDPVQFDRTDVLVIESTYGDRVHERRAEREERLAGIVRSVAESRGTLIIPAFAVGRTQEILYALSALLHEGKIPAMPVYIDSPMASQATEVFRRHPECYDLEIRARLEKGDDPLSFPGLELVRDQQQSQQLNDKPGPKIVISASGMCNAGRVLHHLKHNLWRKEAVVLFVGYQGEGTLGRALAQGAKVVQILGEGIRVRARIEQIGGFSAHADQEGLLSWLKGLAEPPRRVFVVHGEEPSSRALAAKIDEIVPSSAVVPEPYATVELTASGERWLEQRAPLAAPAPARAVARPPAPVRAEVDWAREVHAYLDDMVSRGRLLARDGKALGERSVSAPDPTSRRELAAHVAEFKAKLERILADLTSA